MNESIFPPTEARDDYLVAITLRTEYLNISLWDIQFLSCSVKLDFIL